MIKIGVLGVGHLGKIHLQCLGQLHGRFLLTGFYDPDAGRAGEVEREFGLRRFGSVEELLAAVEAVDIVTPTVTHYELARTALEQGKHLFIEKPVTHTLEEARALIRLRDERKAIVQVLDLRMPLEQHADHLLLLGTETRQILFHGILPSDNPSWIVKPARFVDAVVKCLLAPRISPLPAMKPRLVARLVQRDRA